MRKAAFAVHYATFVLFLLAALMGQEASKPAEGETAARPKINVLRPDIPTQIIRTDVNEVVVRITVTDSYDRLITVLNESNFEVFDDNVKQEIKSFSTEDDPATVGIVLDDSGSMSNKIQRAKEAIEAFLSNSNPLDEFMLVMFRDERPIAVTNTTSKFEDITAEIISERGKGKTPLVDAIYLALNEIKARGTHARKALLVISDGGDNQSRYTWYDLKKMLKEMDVQIYAIGVFEPMGMRAMTPEEASGPSNLLDIANASGGAMFPVDDIIEDKLKDELHDVGLEISRRIRSQYVITYKPSNLLRDGLWRRIKVKLHPPRGLPLFTIHARKGYYAPTN